jgi:predicted deacylase
VNAKRRVAYTWSDLTIEPGDRLDIELKIGESYSGATVRIPIQVRRGLEPGPAVFVTAALHGDELNGTGAIRELILRDDIQLRAGTLMLVPVVNVLAFDRHSRYLPDRRDLNRCFPGTAKGSLASRMARVVFHEIVGRCDYGIDLHTAAIRRTNFPNVRADLSNPQTTFLAQAFGSELIIDGVGPKGSFRREATKAGCPTITFEGGEVWKVEPTIVECILHGTMNVLRELKMIDGESAVTKPRWLSKTKWVRAERGGFLQYHITPGESVETGQPLATNTSLLGRDRNVLTAPFPAIVIGLSTLPAVSPGEPVCHLAKLPESQPDEVTQRGSLPTERLYQRAQDQLATNVMVVEPNRDKNPMNPPVAENQ